MSFLPCLSPFSLPLSPSRSQDGHIFAQTIFKPQRKESVGWGGVEWGGGWIKTRPRNKPPSKWMFFWSTSWPNIGPVFPPDEEKRQSKRFSAYFILTGCIWTWTFLCFAALKNDVIYCTVGEAKRKWQERKVGDENRECIRQCSWRCGNDMDCKKWWEKEWNWKMNRRLTSSLLIFSFSILPNVNQKLWWWHCQKQSSDMIQIFARI